MKIPQHLEGIQREGRSDAFGYTGDSGVEAAFLGSLISKGTSWVRGKAKGVACWACKKACDATVC